MEESVKAAIKMLRPQFLQDGGDIELYHIDEKTGVVSITLSGACDGCGLASMHIKQGVETFLKEQVPEVTNVILL